MANPGFLSKNAKKFEVNIDFKSGEISKIKNYVAPKLERKAWSDLKQNRTLTRKGCTTLVAAVAAVRSIEERGQKVNHAIG